MIGNDAAIAVLGPSTGTDSAEQLERLAEQTGAALAAQGYVVLVMGDGPVARFASAGARAADGAAHAICYPGADGMDGAGVEVERQPSRLRAVERMLGTADAVLVMPGADLDLLVVLFSIWSSAGDREGGFRQVILIGGQWRRQIAAVTKALGLERRLGEVFTLVDDGEDAVETLRSYIHSGR